MGSGTGRRLEFNREVEWEIADLLGGINRPQRAARGTDRRDRLTTTFRCDYFNAAIVSYVDRADLRPEDIWVVVRAALVAAHGPSDQLNAIRCLLALDPPYPDERRVVPGGPTIGEWRLFEDEVRKIKKLGKGAFSEYAPLRRRVAAPILGVSEASFLPRGVGGNAPRRMGTTTRLLVALFLSTVKEAVQQADFAWIIGERQAREAEKLRVDLLDREDLSIEELGRLSLATAAELLEPALELPSFYPTRLDITGLAEYLKVKHLPADWQNSRPDADGLYATLSASGEPLPGVESILARHRAIILGNPGHGKSTMLAATAQRAISSGVPALLVRLPVLARRARPSDLETPAAMYELLVKSAVQSTHKRDGVTTDRPLVEYLQHVGGLVALDGLDEVPAGSARSLVAELLKSLHTYFSGQLIVSSRITGYRQPFGADELLLAPLEVPTDAVDLVNAWFDDRSKDAHRRALDAVAGGAPAEIPLIVGFICHVAETEVVSTTSYGLYQQYLGLFFARPWREPGNVNAGQVLAKKRLAATLAWAMATGQSVRTRKSVPTLAATVPVEWRDVTSIDEAERLTGVEDVADLFEIDGLLVLHGAPAVNPLATEFRWLHRTVHEHLIGSYLVRLEPDEFDRHLPFVAEAVQHPDRWFAPIKHMLEGLDSESQEKVLAHLLKVYDAGDPGGLLLDALGWAARLTHPSTPSRRKVWDLQLRHGDLRAAFAVDDAQTAQLIRGPGVVEVLSTADPAIHSVFHPTSVTVSELCEVLCRILQEEELDPKLLRWAVTLIDSCSREPSDRLLELTALALDRGLPWLATSSFGGFSPSAHSRHVLADAAARSSWSTPQIQVVTLMLTLDTDLAPEIAPHGPLDPSRVALALAAAQDNGPEIRARDTHAYEDPELIRSAVEGALGPSFAYSFARRRGRQAAAISTACAWARVGVLNAAYDQARYGHLWPEWAGSLPSLNEAVSAIRSYRFECRNSPEVVARIVRSVSAIALDQDVVDIATYVGFFREVSQGGFEYDMWGELDDVVALFGGVRDVIRKLPSRDFVHQVLLTDARTWHPDISIGVFDGIDMTEPGSEGLFRRSLRWLVDGGVSPYAGFKTALLPSWGHTVITDILASPREFGLFTTADVQILAYCVSRQGLLPLFRERLIEIQSSIER